MENRILYYFSATGNSLFFAKKFAEKTNAKLVNIVSLLNNLDENQTIETDADVVGIFSPVYFWGLPKLLVHSWKNLLSNQKIHTFTLL